MAEFYKVLKADPLGEPYTPKQAGAKPVQSYWCQVEGQDWSLMIGRQTDNPLHAGQHVYGDLVYAKSQKGTEYWKFKSVKVPDDVQRPTDDPASPAQATAQQATGGKPVDMSAQQPDWFQPWANTITAIYKMVKDLHGGEIEEPAAEPAKDEPKKVEQIAGEPIDKETQETLDNIFGDEPEAPEGV